MPASIDVEQLCRISSAESTDVLPFLTLCFGPRTACAGLRRHDLAGDEPIEQHADGGQVLLDGRLRDAPCRAARCSRRRGWAGCPRARSFCCSHHSENCATATKYARRVLRLRMLAVKNSQKRLPADSERRKIAGSWSAGGSADERRAGGRRRAGQIVGRGESWNQYMITSFIVYPA